MWGGIKTKSGVAIPNAISLDAVDFDSERESGDADDTHFLDTFTQSAATAAATQ